MLCIVMHSKHCSNCLEHCIWNHRRCLLTLCTQFKCSHMHLMKQFPLDSLPPRTQQQLTNTDYKAVTQAKQKIMINVRRFLAPLSYDHQQKQKWCSTDSQCQQDSHGRSDLRHSALAVQQYNKIH